MKYKFLIISTAIAFVLNTTASFAAVEEVKPAASSALDNLGKAAVNVKDAAKDVMTGTADAVKDAAKAVDSNWLGSAVSNTYNSMSTKIDDLKAKFKGQPDKEKELKDLEDSYKAIKAKMDTFNSASSSCKVKENALPAGTPDPKVTEEKNKLKVQQEEIEKSLKELEAKVTNLTK